MPTIRVSQQAIAPGTSQVVEANGRTVAVFNVDGAFYAIDNVCIHSGGPLGEGSLDGCKVMCPWHGWEFDVTNGACLLDDESKVQTFPVTRDGSDIVVDIT